MQSNPFCKTNQRCSGELAGNRNFWVRNVPSAQNDNPPGLRHSLTRHKIGCCGWNKRWILTFQLPEKCIGKSRITQKRKQNYSDGNNNLSCLLFPRKQKQQQSC